MPADREGFKRGVGGYVEALIWKEGDGIMCLGRSRPRDVSSEGLPSIEPGPCRLLSSQNQELRGRARHDHSIIQRVMLTSQLAIDFALYDSGKCDTAYSQAHDHDWVDGQ